MNMNMLESKLYVVIFQESCQNYIDSSGSAIQCMQDKGNGEESDWILKHLILFNYQIEYWNIEIEYSMH